MAAVSMMSWLVAPLCTAALAAGSGTRRVSARASPGTGLPVSADDWLSSARSKSPVRAAAAVTAAPAPAGASPARSSARASAGLGRQHGPQPGRVVGDRAAAHEHAAEHSARDVRCPARRVRSPARHPLAQTPGLALGHVLIPSSADPQF